MPDHFPAVRSNSLMRDALSTQVRLREREDATRALKGRLTAPSPFPDKLPVEFHKRLEQHARSLAARAISRDEESGSNAVLLALTALVRRCTVSPGDSRGGMPRMNAEIDEAGFLALVERLTDVEARKTDRRSDCTPGSELHPVLPW